MFLGLPEPLVSAESELSMGLDSGLQTPNLPLARKKGRGSPGVTYLSSCPAGRGLDFAASIPGRELGTKASGLGSPAWGGQIVTCRQAGAS